MNISFEYCKKKQRTEYIVSLRDVLSSIQLYFMRFSSPHTRMDGTSQLERIVFVVDDADCFIALEQLH